MIRLLRHRPFGLLLIAVLALAGIAGAFAHRASPEETVRIQTYVLAGGSMADLCSDMVDPGAMPPDCPICHLLAAAVLPPPPGAAGPAGLVLPGATTAPRESLALRHVRDPARGVRGPPVA